MTCFYKLFTGLVLLLVSCNLPRDPEKTLVSVQNDTLKVGIVENPPWTTYASGNPAGVEVEMVKKIAQSLSADIQWFRGGEAELFETLMAKELHLVIGGFTKKNPWSRKIGFTNPYRTTTVYIGTPRAVSTPRHIRKVRVGVEAGTPVAGYVRKKGGKPVGIPDLKSFQGPVAAPRWKLQQMDFLISDIKLHEEKNVFAIIRGENAWVMFLERFFYRNKKQIEQWLKEADHEENPAI